MLMSMGVGAAFWGLSFDCGDDDYDRLEGKAKLVMSLAKGADGKWSLAEQNELLAYVDMKNTGIAKDPRHPERSPFRDPNDPVKTTSVYSILNADYPDTGFTPYQHERDKYFKVPPSIEIEGTHEKVPWHRMKEYTYQYIGHMSEGNMDKFISSRQKMMKSTRQNGRRGN